MILFTYYCECKEFVVQKSTSVISTHYYRHIPTLCCDAHRTSVPPYYSWTFDEVMMRLQFFREFYAPLCILKEYGLLGTKGRTGPDRTGLPFRWSVFVYNNKRTVILSFPSFRILAPRREASQANWKNICLSKARPVSITALSSTSCTDTHTLLSKIIL